MSKHEEKVDAMKTKQISDDQSRQTDKDGQKSRVSGGKKTIQYLLHVFLSLHKMAAVTYVAAAYLVETCKPRHNRPALTDFCQKFLLNVQALEHFYAEIIVKWQIT